MYFFVCDWPLNSQALHLGDTSVHRSLGMTEDIAILKAYVIDLERRVRAGKLLVEEIERDKNLIIHFNKLETLQLTLVNQKVKDIFRVDLDEIDFIGEEKFIKSVLHPEEYPHMQSFLGRFSKTASGPDSITFMQRVFKNRQYFNPILTTTKLADTKDYFISVSTELQDLKWFTDRIRRELDDQLYVAEHLPSFQTLTKREREIIAYVTEGHQNKEIADRLFITLETVKQHRKAIRIKLGLDSIAEVVRFGLAFNLRPDCF
jgi:DNA-binding CsgD family transcriptional regulator